MSHRVVGPDGTVIPLDGTTGFKLLMGSQGRIFPSFQMIERETLGQHGALLEHVQVMPRTVALPVLVKADSQSVHERIRHLAGVLNPLRGDARWVVEHPDGTSRELVGRLRAPDAPEGEGSRSGGWQRTTLEVRCHEPFWRDATETVETFLAGLTDFFPWWPYEIASSSIMGEVEVDNTGDVEAWPVWRVRGPGGPFHATIDDDTWLTVDTVLAAGEELRVDTRPPGMTDTPKAVTGPSGENLYPNVPADASLFPLPSGLTVVNVEIENADDDSRVILSYRRRGFTP